MQTKRDRGYLSTNSNHTLMYLFTCYSAQLERHSLLFYILFFIHWELFHQKTQIDREQIYPHLTQNQQSVEAIERCLINMEFHV